MTEPTTPEQPATGDVYDVGLVIIDELGQQGIAKTGWNEHSKYKFRSIEAVLAAFNRLMVKHRLLILPALESHESERNGKNTYTTVVMRYTFRAADGSSFSLPYGGCGGDVGDKAMGKAQTNALKQMLTDVFKIPAEGMIDGDETTPDRNEAEQAQHREQVAEMRAREQARDRLLKSGSRKGLDADGVIAWCLQQYNAHPKTATVQDLIIAEQELAKLPNRQAGEQQGGSRPKGSENHPSGRRQQGRPPQQRGAQQGRKRDCTHPKGFTWADDGNGHSGSFCELCGAPEPQGRPGIPGQRDAGEQ